MTPAVVSIGPCCSQPSCGLGGIAECTALSTSSATSAWLLTNPGRRQGEAASRRRLWMGLHARPGLGQKEWQTWMSGDLLCHGRGWNEEEGAGSRQGYQQQGSESMRVRCAAAYDGNVSVVQDTTVPQLQGQGREEEEKEEAKQKEEDEEVLIECRDVYKSFGSKHILKGASFKIRYGEAVGIIGPSGTGKSTILKIMAGLLAPDQGEVLICGKLRSGLISDHESLGLRIGLVFQSAALFDSLNVRQNVGFMLYEHSDLSEEEISLRVADSLAAVGLKGVEDRFPAQLSGGMKKRVALARAIISDSRVPQMEREVVMYDEPTAGLDPIASTVVEDLIRSLHIKDTSSERLGKIASYVVVTHQHSTIRRAVDRLLFLYGGKVVWEGTTEEFDTSDNPIVRQFADGSLNGPIRY